MSRTVRTVVLADRRSRAVGPEIGWMSRTVVGWMSRTVVGWMSRTVVGWMSRTVRTVSWVDVPDRRPGGCPGPSLGDVTQQDFDRNLQMK
jgi:hypothetical protein